MTTTADRADIVCKRMLVKTSVKDNNNKYWEGILHTNDDVLCRWGRVGAARGQQKLFPGRGLKFLESKIRSKTKKGYEEMDAADDSGTVEVKSIKGRGLKAVAKKQIRSSGCKTTDGLIDYLVQVNRHDIKTASGGRISVDDEGLVKTDVGRAVSQTTIDNARDHLVVLSKCLSKADWESDIFCDNLNAFLKKIPQKVGARKGWARTFLADQSSIQRQGSLLDSMESALKAVQASPLVTADGKEEQVFNVEISRIEDSREINRINKKFSATLDRAHQSSRLSIKNVYLVSIQTMLDAFDNNGAILGNIKELWHGTSSANLLSILKCGLVIPPANASHCTGRMWGAGGYFASSSTKSLNYSTGFWGQAGTRRTFMFLVDVALGKTYTPRSGTSWGYTLPKGYDSTWAKKSDSGLRHLEKALGRDEFITPHTHQCNLTRLVEFE